MDKILNEYINYIQYTEPRSVNTVQAYRKDLEDFVIFLENIEIKDFNDVDYDILLTYISEIESDYTRSSVDRKISSIKNFFKYMIQFNIINYNVTSYLKSQKRALKLPNSLNQDELNTLFSFEKKEGKDYLDIAILKVIFSTGIRVSECVNLKFNQVFLEERWLKIIGKGNKERMVPITQDALDSLIYYMNVIRPQFVKRNSHYVFITKNGNHITRQYIHTMIQLRREETGLSKKVSAHTLRHSLATEMLNESVDLRVIQEILGHSDIKTTQIYTHVDNQAVKNEYDRYFKVDFNSNKGGNDDEI